ncbi:Bromodomain protein [Theileria parva strain Muguga]|uniref:Bromodomain protein n=1 Tax=Theileria parva strain Muguga TaxID=333668 RepID=UPI001C616D20|nr:Bromodomain protein [Theileria parva strain Muguga]EAN32481.2 Bromodomain protein [Theileria parva strain Muguga]
MESQKDWIKYCSDHILRKMRSDRYGNLFATPVLEASDSIIPPSVKDNYRIVIRKPMDYKTVKMKLDSGSYMNPDEFCEDMKLIYDNCMRFNPPIGNSKWAHDAAVTNLKKFMKMWETSYKVIQNLYERTKNSMVTKTEPISTVVMNNFASVNSNYLNASDINKSRMTEGYDRPYPATDPYSKSLSADGYTRPFSSTDGVNSYPSMGSDPAVDLSCTFSNSEVTPRNKWSFRLSLQSIQEYKLRKGFVNQVPESNGFSSYLDPKITREHDITRNTNPQMALSYDGYPTVGTALETSNYEVYNESGLSTYAGAVDYEDFEGETHASFEYEVPQILSKNDDGIVCVSFLSDNDCNTLFPDWNVIGFTPEKTYSSNAYSTNNRYISGNNAYNTASNGYNTGNSPFATNNVRYNNGANAYNSGSNRYSSNNSRYTMSDVNIRYVYNQLYLNDINSLKFDHKQIIQEKEPVEEEYKLDLNHPKIKFSLNNSSEMVTTNPGSPDTSFYNLETDEITDNLHNNHHGRKGFRKFVDNLFVKKNNSHVKREHYNGHTSDLTNNNLINKFFNADSIDLNNTYYLSPNSINLTSNTDFTPSNGDFTRSNGDFTHSNGNYTDSNGDYTNSHCDYAGFNQDLNYNSDLTYNKDVNYNGDYITSDKDYLTSSRDIDSNLDYLYCNDLEYNVLGLRPKEETLDLYIDIDSNSIVNASETALLLEKNFFSRVSVKDQYFKIYEKPQLSLICSNKGYFKLDESDFVYEDVDMKHIRIFFFNCSKSKVKVSSRKLSFTDLVLGDRYNLSLVNNLHNDFKLGNVSNLPFFTLPNSTPICFSKQQDILYRLQLINNSLPVQLLALHIISTH